MPEDAWEAQKVATLLIFFRSMVVLTSSSCLVGPFIWGNPPAALTYLLWMFCILLVVPYRLMAQGKLRAAYWVFTIGMAFSWQILVSLSGGVRSPMACGLFLIIITSGVVLGRNAALWIAGSGSLVNLALTVWTLRGHSLPVIFPIPPIAAWFTQLLLILFVVPALLGAIQRLRDAVESSEEELNRQMEARRQILFQLELLEHAPDPIFSIDNLHLVNYWNRAAEVKFQISKADAMRQEILSLLRVEDAEDWLSACASTTATGYFSGELALTLADGSRIRLEAVIQNIADVDGRVYSRVAGFRDVTEARRAEEALRHSEERLRLITDAAPVGLFVLDSSNNVVFANRYFVERQARSRGNMQMDLKNRTLELRDLSGAVIPIEEYPSQIVRKSGQPIYDRRVRVQNPLGEVGYFSLSAAPLDRVGKDVIMVFDDISEKVKLEDQYLQAQKMEGIGLLAGGVAHDFNNLLMVINGSCDRLLAATAEGDPRRRDILNTLTAGRRAADLTHQLLAVGRRQSGLPEPLLLNQVIREFQPLLQSILRENIALEIALSQKEGWLMADPAQIHQVLMNLVINAQEAMPEGGQLRIQSAVVNQSGNEMVELRISDTGCGMEPETLQRVFEPFFSTKDRDTNTGLGLSTVYGIVQQNGGQLHVESVRGVGSTFLILFPATERPMASPELKEVPNYSVAGTVLIVEDREDVREFLASSLCDDGFTVLQAENGAAALAIAENTKVDVLLSDMIMPGISGKELAMQMTATRPELSVILMTGYSNELLDRQAFPAHRFHLLRKPFTRNALHAALTDCLRKGAQIE